jgi:uncharacterized membrane protein
MNTKIKLKTQQQLMMAGMTIICLVLSSIRIKWTGSITYGFLIWNLFLAWMPLLFSQVLLHHIATAKKWKSILLFSAWLAFFPNAPYIISDFMHLAPKNNIPLWFDILLLISFAWTGLILGILSLLDVHEALLNYLSSKTTWLAMICILFLSAYGIYLGRFIRLNSWEVATDPLYVLKQIFYSISNPASLPRVLGVTLGFGIFLVSTYSTIYFLKSNKEVK